MKFLILLLIFWGGFVQARPYNYRDVPIGERSFGMGSTAMALTGDVGNLFYNPAVMAYEESSQVSASLSSYSRIDTRTGEYVSLFKSARDNVRRGGFVAIPSLVGGNLKTGNVIWGGGIFVPDTFRNSGTLNVSNTEDSIFESRYSSVWIGAFAARKFGNFGVGAALFYSSIESDEKFFFVSKESGLTKINFVQNIYNPNGLVFLIGGTWDLSENLRLGYSLRLPALHLGGVGEYTDTQSGVVDNPKATEFNCVLFPMPVRLSVGAAWIVAPRMTVAADLHFYKSLYGNIAGPGGAAPFLIDAMGTANMSLGFEHFPWHELGYRFGFYTNVSSARNLPTYLTAIADKVHMFGGAAALVFEKKSGTLSLGGYVQGGQGSSTSVQVEPRTVVPRSNYNYGFVVGSSYKFTE